MATNALETNPHTVGTNPHTLGTNPRPVETNPHTLGTNPHVLEARLERSLATKDHPGGRVGSSGLVYAELSHTIVGAAIEVHRHVGPGQLESVYQRALASELARRSIPARAQVPIEMRYKGDKVGDFFADFIVDAKIVVELKATDRPHGAHVAQVLSYLRATKLRLGLLINFNAAVLYRGVRRVILD